MPTFTKTAVNSITGGSTSDLLRVTLGEHLLTGTITGGLGTDTLRFSSTLAGDLLFFGESITGVERVEIGGGVGKITRTTAALDIDASTALNALTITGNDGDNLILATEFDDTVVLTRGVDHLFGGDGDDVFRLTAVAAYNAESVIDGEGGDDLLLVSGAGSVALGAATFVERIEIAGTTATHVDASDVIASVRITGNSAGNRLAGTAGDDTIVGGPGRDTLLGGDGDDVFLVGLPADLPSGEQISGEEGFDELRLLASGGGTVFTLPAATSVEQIVVSDEEGDTSGTGYAKVDASVVTSGGVTIIGNSGPTDLVGTRFADTLVGGLGDDIFHVLDGSHHAAGELILGGGGFDKLSFYWPVAPQTGVFELVIQPGTEVERFEVGSPARSNATYNIDASALAVGVSIIGHDGSNRLVGGSGNDTIASRAGSDTLIGGAGDDLLQLDTTAPALVEGGDGFDTLFLTMGLYALTAVTGMERIALNSTSSVNAELLSTFGLELVGGSLGNQITATQQADDIDGQAGNDTLYARGGDDTVRGGAGNDELYGESGNDLLEGGLGDDTLLGQGGADTMDGGDGSDFYEADADDTVDDTGASGIDTLFIGGHETVVLTSAPGIEQVRAWFDVDASAMDRGLSYIAHDPGLAITGSAFADRFAGFSTVAAGDGNDVFIDPVVAQLDGEGGTDELWVQFGEKVSFRSTWSGIEVVRLVGPDGSAAGAESRTATLGSAPNALDIHGNDGANRITATRFDDTIAGNGGKDTIAGGLGNDTIAGGAGIDHLYGGEGNDVFTDFEAGERVFGEAGTDTLLVTGAGQTLDLVTVSNAALRSVEVIDISGSGDNTLRLNFDDVKYNLGAGGTLTVERDAGDEVDLLGAWLQDTVGGGYTTYRATKNGQTVFVRIADVDGGGGGGEFFEATSDIDDFAGGDGNDTVSFEDYADLEPGDQFHGGAGDDVLRFEEGTAEGAGPYVMNNAVFSGFERVELSGTDAHLILNDDVLAVTLLSGGAYVTLGQNAAQTVQGSEGADRVELGAAGQTVSLGGGDDRVDAHPSVVGANIDGGTGSDVIYIDGGEGGVAVMGAGIVGVERVVIHNVEFTANATPGLVIDSEGWAVIELGAAGQSVNGSEQNETVQLSAAFLSGATLKGGGGDLDGDLLQIYGSASSIDLNDAALIQGFERLEYGPNVTELVLNDDGYGVEVTPVSQTIVSGDVFEGGSDRFVFRLEELGFGGRQVTIQGFDRDIESSHDEIEIWDGDAVWGGNVDAAMVDTVLAGAATLVYDQTNGRLIVDIDASGAYEAGNDLTVVLGIPSLGSTELLLSS